MISADYEEKPEAEDGSLTPDAKLVELQSQWLQRIETAEKAAAEYFEEVKRAIRWLRLDKDSRRRKTNGDKLNIAFANYEVMRSTVYARPPQIVVQPRFGGGPMRPQLVAISEVMERAVASEAERQKLHASLKMARDELLKAGRGVIWVRYKADLVEQPLDPMAMPESGVESVNPTTEALEYAMQPEPQTIQVKVGEQLYFDVISWRKFLHGPAEHWGLVPWVARYEDMTREQIKERFKLDRSAQDILGLEFGEAEGGKTGAPKTTEGQTCRVYEIWCKTSGKVYFVARGASQLIEPPSDPLIKVDGFFPCPEPAMSISEDGMLRPVPDVIMIEDQLTAIDRLTARIGALEQALKVRGFYGKGATDTTAADAIEEAIRSNDDRQVIIPVPSFAAGGTTKLDIVWLPIDVVVQVILALRQQRQEAVELVYQITGISDVMRGASEASETLGAQQIKDRWGSVRVRDKQEEMRRLARDVFRIAAEVICEEFDPQNIAQLAVYGFDPQMMEILRDDKTRSLVIDVETDSTVQADEQEEKQRATEFVTSVGGILMQGVQLAQAAPELVPLIGATLKHVATRHRAGREIEAKIEEAVQMLEQRVSQQQQQAAEPKPDPAIETKKAELDLRREEAAARLSLDREKMMIDAETKVGIAAANQQARLLSSQRSF